MKNKTLLTCINLAIFVGVGFFVLYGVYSKQAILINTLEAEARLRGDQVQDFALHAIKQRDAAFEADRLGYYRGFEEGRNAAALALMNEEALMDYTDGYHAATHQFDATHNSDSALGEFIDLYQDAIDSGSTGEARVLIDVIMDQIALDIETSELDAILREYASEE